MSEIMCTKMPKAGDLIIAHVFPMSCLELVMNHLSFLPCSCVLIRTPEGVGGLNTSNKDLLRLFRGLNTSNKGLIRSLFEEV